MIPTVNWNMLEDNKRIDEIKALATKRREIVIGEQKLNGFSARFLSILCCLPKHTWRCVNPNHLLTYCRERNGQSSHSAPEVQCSLYTEVSVEVLFDRLKDKVYMRLASRKKVLLCFFGQLFIPVFRLYQHTKIRLISAEPFPDGVSICDGGFHARPGVTSLTLLR